VITLRFWEARNQPLEFEKVGRGGEKWLEMVELRVDILRG
jgi:hypothetical protein